MNGWPRSDSRQTAGQRDQQADAKQRQRLDQQRLPRTLDPVGNRVEREGRRRHQAADESAARFVVAAQQQEDGKEQQQRHQQASGGAEDRRGQRRFACRFHVGPLGGRQPQQRADTDRGGREHRDLAHRVERRGSRPG